MVEEAGAGAGCSREGVFPHPTFCDKFLLCYRVNAGDSTLQVQLQLMVIIIGEVSSLALSLIIRM